jgi:hypothetical protein
MKLMRLPSPPRTVVVSREDKEARLKDFISASLSVRHDGEVESFHPTMTLIARAPDSPVAQAVMALAPSIHAANVALQVVLFETEPMAEDSVQSSLLDVNGIELRMLTDLRFASAHEQLVLSTGDVWIGDCMRRDPVKRDAFEMFHSDNATMTGHATQSFAKLWQKSVPLSRVVAASISSATVVLAGQPAPDVGGVTSRR